MAVRRPQVFWPLTVGASNNKVRLWSMSTGGVTATIASATYTHLPTLYAAIKTACEAAHGSFPTLTVDQSWFGTGQLRIVSNNNQPFIDTSHADSIATWLGFTTGVGNISAAQLPHAMGNSWLSPVAVRKDSANIFDRQMHTATRSIGGQVKVIEEAELLERNVLFQWLPPTHTYIAGETTAPNINTAIERWWRSGNAQFRYYANYADPTVEYADYSLSQESIEKFEPSRMFDRKALYEIGFKMWGYVA